MKRPIYFSIALAGSLALGGLLTVLPPLPFALPSTQLACHGKGQCDLQQPLEKPPYFREDEGSLREMSLIQPIPGESDSHIEFKCLVEYNGWFRRIIRVKDVKVISKTKEFKGKIDYSIPDPNKIEIQASLSLLMTPLVLVTMKSSASLVKQTKQFPSLKKDRQTLKRPLRKA